MTHPNWVAYQISAITRPLHVSVITFPSHLCPSVPHLWLLFWRSQKFLPLLKPPFQSLLQNLVARLVFVAGAGNGQEELDHAVPVVQVDVLGANLLLFLVHVVVIAQGDAD